MHSSNLQHGKETPHHRQDATGWSALAKLVRGIDEDKVQDCKEDIDTLLVFAGLFSAVMTAFIIESYKTLQQDPATVSVELLRQIALKSSVGLAQPAGNDAASTANTPFAPSASAIQVNVLWFASLILSLITASIGILVKQWLREYLGGEYVTPRAQLRIRHFRHPGLERWKVFEIVAFLPLLLQASLALFLSGLCIFTASIHPSIGYTALPLVMSWSAFVLVTAISPVFSAISPYKSPFLKHVFAALRPRLRSLWRGKETLIRRLLCSSSRRDVSENHPVLSSGELEEEKDVVLDNSSDANILTSVDELLLDDDILETVILPSLHESEINGGVKYAFLRGVIWRRLPKEGVMMAVNRLPIDLHALSHRAWKTVMGLVLDTLRRQLENEDKTHRWETWMDNAILLLLSPNTRHHEPHIAQDVSETIRFIVQKRREYVCGAIASMYLLGRRNAQQEAAAAQSLGTLVQALGTSQGQDRALAFSCLKEIVGRRIHGSKYQPETFRLSELFGISWWRSSFTLGNLRDIAALMTSMLLEQLEHMPIDQIPWLADALSFVVNTMSIMAEYSEGDQRSDSSRMILATGLRNLLTRKDTSHFIFASLSKVAPQSFERGNFILDTLQMVYLRDQAAIDNFVTFMGTESASGASPIRLAFLAICCIKLPEALKLRRSWQKLFTVLATAILHAADNYLEDNQALSEHCISMVHAEYHLIGVDVSRFYIPRPLTRLAAGTNSLSTLDDEEAYTQWRDRFDPDKSLFPDEFVSALSTVARKEMRWYRVRRLMELE